MEFWMTFWKVVFIGILILFAFMSVFVTIGGFRDIKILFREMDEKAKKAAEEKG